MARGIYLHELVDPEISWLIQNFKEKRSEFLFLEPEELPVSMVYISNNEYHNAMSQLENMKAEDLTEAVSEKKSSEKSDKA